MPSWISDRNDFSYFWSISCPDISYPTKFWVSWPFGSGDERQYRFSRWPPWRPSWVSDQNDFSYFDPKATQILPTKFRVNRLFSSGEEAQNRFARVFPIGTNFSYFWSASCLDTSYQASSLLVFRFRRRRENGLSWWLPWRPSWIYDRNDLRYFLIYKLPGYFLKVNSELAFWFIRSAKWVSDRNDFSYSWFSSHGGHHWFPIGTILTVFDLQVLILPIKFRVSWPFGSGDEVQNRFSRWRPFWISDPNDFSYFWSTSHPDASYHVSSQFAQGRRRRLLK